MASHFHFVPIAVKQTVLRRFRFLMEEHYCLVREEEVLSQAVLSSRNSQRTDNARLKQQLRWGLQRRFV